MRRPFIHEVLVEAARAYETTCLVADLSTGISKLGAKAASWKAGRKFDQVFGAPQATKVVRWVEHLARLAHVDQSNFRRFAARTIADLAPTDQVDPEEPAHELPADPSAMLAALNLPPTVGVAGVDPPPGQSEALLVPLNLLRSAILEGEASARCFPDGPDRESALAGARLMRETLRGYGEHRDDQRKWRAESARRRKPLRMSQTWVRTNRDPNTDGPRCA